MNKTELRKLLKNHPVDDLQKRLEQEYLLKILWDLLKIHKPTCIGLYAVIEQEIDLTSIFEQCQIQGVLTAYPRIINDQIIFHEVSSKNGLTPGFYNIHEPPQSAPILHPDFLVVPGLAFTKDGKRLGRGKGHYDKYLEIHNAYTVSLAFSWQVLDSLPTEPHDIKIDHIISFNKP